MLGEEGGGPSGGGRTDQYGGRGGCGRGSKGSFEGVVVRPPRFYRASATLSFFHPRRKKRLAPDHLLPRPVPRAARGEGEVYHPCNASSKYLVTRSVNQMAADFRGGLLARFFAYNARARVYSGMEN